MGGEWSKAVKIIFNKKYSNGRGKLVDAMKDPETKAIHSSMLGKKPMKMETKMNKNMNINMKKMNKTQKFKKKMRGGAADINTIGDLIKTKLQGKKQEVIEGAIEGIEQILNAANESGSNDGNQSEGDMDNKEEPGTTTTPTGTTATPTGTTTTPTGTTDTSTGTGSGDKMEGGQRSKKNRSNKMKDKKNKSFRKKCGW